MIAPNFMAFPLEPLLAGLRAAFVPTARQKNVRFVVASSPLTVYSDPALLERVMANSFSNALRYTDKGGVIVACRPAGRDVRLEVWDSGIGIPAAHQEADRPRSHAHAGLEPPAVAPSGASRRRRLMHFPRPPDHQGRKP